MKDSQRQSVPAWMLGVLLPMVSGAAGCHSIMFVDGPPPEDQRKAAFTCTDSYFWPVADAVLSGTVIGASALIARQQTFSLKDGGDLVLISTLVATAAFAGGSAGYGYHEVNKCRDAQRRADEYRRWLRSTPSPPQSQP